MGMHYADHDHENIGFCYSTYLDMFSYNKCRPYMILTMGFTIYQNVEEFKEFKNDTKHMF